MKLQEDHVGNAPANSNEQTEELVDDLDSSQTPTQDIKPDSDKVVIDPVLADANDTITETGNQEELEACIQAIHDRGFLLPEEGYVDYKGGFRIFPLLHFILTKESIPATRPGEDVYMLDNPVFVTEHENYADALVFAPVHSQRTGVIQGIPGMPQNEVTEYYTDILYGPVSHHLATDVGPTNKSVPVTRDTWGNELSEYTEPCEDVLALPPAQDEPPTFHTSGAMFPFTEEIDFIAGQSRVGYSLLQTGKGFRFENKKIAEIQIPILLYCPGCEVDSVEMVQDDATLHFQTSKYDYLWKEWLGDDWHAFTSEWVDFDEDLFMKAELDKIDSDTPPFISDSPSTIGVTMDGERVTFMNH